MPTQVTAAFGRFASTLKQFTVAQRTLAVIGLAVLLLGGFAVVDAEPGVSTTVRVPVAVQAFRTWDTGCGGWTVPAGTYRLRVGRSSRDLRLAVDVVQPSRAPAPQ